MKYRSDIDGLRAIAVLAVLFYHADLAIFSGGFVGVDVFFVISGFLITKKIASEIQAHKFSLASFYEARIRRIFPALFVVIAFTVFVGAWLFEATSYMELGKSVTATTLFWSNILFHSQAGYFDAPSTLKPLLHMWSLSVEEQFYFFLPLFLVFLTWLFKEKRVFVLALVGIFSLVLNIYILNQDPSAAFFLAHLRAWELLMGSLIALKSVRLNPRFYSPLSFLGVSMILGSIVLFSDETLFPGVAALVPVIGSALVIYSGIDSKTWVGKILSTKPFVFIGKISYSLYLWHWPLIVFGKYWLIRQLTALDIIVLLAFSFVMATLSWKFIETPFRSKSFLKRYQIFITAASVMAVVLFFGVAINLKEGFPERFASPPEGMIEYSEWKQEREVWKVLESCGKFNPGEPSTSDWCSLGDATKTPTFLVWGDSHARAISPGIHVSALDSGVGGYLAVRGACPPLLGVTSAPASAKSLCVKYNDMVIDYIAGNPEIETVLLIGRWDMSADGRRYKTEEGETEILLDVRGKIEQGDINTNAVLFETGLQRTVDQLIDLGRNVVIVIDVPEIGYHVSSAHSIALRTGRDVNEIIAPTLNEYETRSQVALSVIREMQKSGQVQTLDPATILCGQQKCIVVFDNKPLYKDYNHLSVFGAYYVSSIFDPVFEAIAAEGK